jgi:3-dehydroquinate synthase
MSDATRIHVGEGSDSAYDVVVGTGLLGELPALLGSGVERVLVVHPHALRAKGAAVRDHLEAQGFSAFIAEVPDAEAAKSPQVAERLWAVLGQSGFTRSDAIVGVGGGTVTDLAGFVAATWLRGVKVVQVPTTLLAMVDSSLGGKTGVDLPGGKNLVGTFLQPTAVYADVDLLATLPRRQFLLGFAEVVKTAVIADATFFRWLESNATALRAGETRSLAHAIERCLRIKARIVAQDERESGRRAVLNFGHTVAHAIEAASGYRIPHGRAVAIGLAVESRLAVVATGFSAESSERIASLLRAIGLPARWPRSLEVDRVLEATRRDKKAREGQARYALPTSLGRMPAADATTVAVAEKALRRAVQESCAGAPG